MTAEELTPSEFAIIARFEHLLADDAVWITPDPAAEDAVLAEIAGARARPPVATGRGARRWIGIGAAAALGAAAAAAITVVVMRDRVPAADASLALVGTELAPDLHGSASLWQQTSGLEIEVRMPGLPRRDGGEFYELWMHKCDGSEWVPAGTFHDMAYIRAWAGVPVKDFPVLKVTREEALSGDASVHGPSGDVVAQGQYGDCPA
jgi:hypothetical protein